MHFIYILKSDKDGGYYVGITTNLEKRLASHNLGSTKSTKGRRPFRLIYSEVAESRIEAREREKYLKSYDGSKEKLSIIDKVK